jgi:hypothetical protein
MTSHFFGFLHLEGVAPGCENGKGTGAYSKCAHRWVARDQGAHEDHQETVKGCAGVGVGSQLITPKQI